MIITFLIFSIFQMFYGISEAGIGTVLYEVHVITHDKEFGDGNASITYSKKGDLTSYGVDFDQYIYKSLNSLLVQVVVIKYPSIGHWKEGSVLIDLTFDFCEIFKKKRRKSDFMAHAILEVWEKYGNVSLECPIKKGFVYLRGATFKDVKIPVMQYFINDIDVNFMVKLYTKVRNKLHLLETISYISGIRKVSGL